MEWFSIHERFRLRDGDLAVVTVDKNKVHRAGVLLAVYKNESFLDAIVLDDAETINEEWTSLNGVCINFAPIGINVFDNLKQYN